MRSDCRATKGTTHLAVHMIEGQLPRRIPEMLSLTSDAVTAGSNLSDIGIDSPIALGLGKSKNMLAASVINIRPSKN